MDWFPNIDALDFYLREIHPLVRRGPETTLRIVGRRLSSSDAERFRSFAGVDVVGEVEDVQAELANAAVIVVPLRIGGGSRLKILEALAAGKAVVSTTVGAEGLAVQDSLHLRIADTPKDFAEAVHSLLSDPAARRVLGTNGRRLVEQKYGWDALSQGLEAAWKDAAKARASR
jgi:glycosyltransferase involved in cell wall biosynthesis